jgi:uncharacterized protein (DUF362 family)/NAD-dependent dihydropyrimidine dehydrogenase PreA subunit
MSQQKTLTIQKIVGDDVEKAVFDALNAIKAKSLMKKQGMKILLKVNLLSAKPPERAVTTHPSVVRAVIRWLKQFNPSKIYVGDSSGGSALNSTALALKASGIQAVCDEEGAVAIPLEKTERKIYPVPNPLILNEIASTKLLEEVDLIVNLPKIKTHSQCILTCCIKNMFGTIILTKKAEKHARFPAIDQFCSALVDIYSVSKPQLTVVDGFLAMEGNGPGAGDVVDDLKIILAGYDGVALDTLVCKIIGLDPAKVLYIEKGTQKGIGSSNLEEFEIIGQSIESVFRPFNLPRLMPVSLRLPRVVAEYISDKIFKSTIKFDMEKCKLCGTCWKNCPVDALTPPKDLKIGEYIPIWDKKKCISCYCCAELCPYEAVEFKIKYFKNFLFSYLGLGCLSLITVLALLIIFL